MTYEGCLNEVWENGKLISRTDTRTLSEHKAQRIEFIKTHCEELISLHAPDFKQLKAMQCLSGIAVDGYFPAKAQAILKTANGLRAMSNALEKQVNACTDCEQVDAIWWNQ